MILRAAPNPSSHQTSIRFSIPNSGLAQACVLDLSGRVIRRLADASFAAGVHDLAWDGCDDEGREVAAGIYLVRVTTPASEQTARVVIVR
jgi:flagellar hook assembly protein FlgD